MEIQKLDRDIYAGQQFTVRYQTNGFYDIRPVESGFQVEHQSFDAPVEKSFDDVFFSKWLDDPVAYGAFEDGRLLGYVEGFLETWNNRYRISNICIFVLLSEFKSISNAFFFYFYSIFCFSFIKIKP